MRLTTLKEVLGKMSKGVGGDMESKVKILRMVLRNIYAYQVRDADIFKECLKLIELIVKTDRAVSEED